MRAWHAGPPALLILILVLAASPASAQTLDQQWTYCVNDKNSYSSDQSIAGCAASPR